MFSNLTTSIRNNAIVLFFSSDALYLPSIFKDLFIDGNDMSGWHFNPAPNFFPDMIFYFLLMFLVKNFIYASFLFALIQYIFLAFLFVRLFKLVSQSNSSYYTLVIYSLLSFFILEFFFFSQDFWYVFYLIVNSYHTGAFIITLLCLVLSFKYIRDHKIIWPILITVIGFLMIQSDRLFILLYCVPICLTSLCLYKKIGLKQTILLNGINILMVGVGLVIFSKINTYAYVESNKFLKPFDFDVIKSQFGIFFGDLFSSMTEFSIRTVTLYMFFISLGMMTYVFFMSLKNTKDTLAPFYALFSLIFSICVICGPMASGKFLGWDCLRYNIYPFYLAVLNVAVFFWYTIKTQVFLVTGKYLIVGFSILLMSIGIAKFRYQGLIDYFNYYPEIVQNLDAVAEKEDLKYGVTNYWEAKVFTMFSKKGLKVYSVFDDLAIHQHVANDNWYFGNIFNFVILSNFADTNLYRKKINEIKYVSNLPNFRMIKCSPFTYFRFVGGSVVNVETNDK
ncbi:hypothetical protein [Aurantibacillus circumpalustris]|uniref:hypothetical protein n=1 Tax=Aurantibacillus circumpalustris TaxID=3036359 RepID=UPI00295A57D6|nr:hypothetical protein [Aurantibacillus circumpalustris]